ncbi:ABC transporter substrate-binding protein [Mycoplasmatota bacterium WC30]
MKKRFLLLFITIYAFTFVGCDFGGATSIVTTTILETTESVCVVSFDSLGGSMVDPVDVPEGGMISIPSTEREGYTLVGWYTSLNDGVTLDEKWSFLTNAVNSDITLYAKWDTVVYTLKYIDEDGSVLYNEEQDYNISLSSLITPENPTKEGYAFSGWDIILPENMPAEDVTIQATYSINQYSINFDSNGGTEVQALTQDYNTYISQPISPTKEGHSFEGWFLDEQLTQSYIFSTMQANDIVLYAKWSKDAVPDLNWNIGTEPIILDPALNTSSAGGDVINQTFEGLVREVGGVVSPGIAESWETSADGLTVTFHLRESKWNDGSDLTADDFVYAWKRGMDPAIYGPYAWIWQYTNIVGAVEAVYYGGSLNNVGITAVDDYTLQVDLLYPTPYFVSLMSFYYFMPVKQSAVEAEGGADGAWAKDPNLAVSNGPFKLTEYDYGYGLKLVKNDEYWNADEVYLDKINGYFIDLETTAYVAYNAGELDVLPSVPNAMIAALREESSEFYVLPVLGTYFYDFNMQDGDGTWDNLNLRKALTYAIDRTSITNALSGGEVPATGLIGPGFLDNNGDDFAFESGNYGIPVDDSKFAEAVILFATAAGEMGMTVSELQSYLSGKVITYNTSEHHKLVAEMVQESWRQVLGIEVILQNQDWSIFQNSREEGNFDIARGGWLTDYMDPVGLLSIFYSGNIYNDPGYYNSTYDTLIIDALSTTDNETHFATLYAAQDELMGDLPIIPIYYYSDVYLIKDYVTGWGRSVLGSIDFTHARIDE